MANLSAAKKSIKQDKKRQASNLSRKSELKTLMKKLNSFIESNKADEATSILSLLTSKLDKAAKKNIIKRHNADRKKSHLSSKVAKLKANKTNP